MESKILTHIYGLISVLIGIYSIYANGLTPSDRLFWLSIMLVGTTLIFILVLSRIIRLVDKKNDELKSVSDQLNKSKYELDSAQKEIENFKIISTYLASERLTEPARRKASSSK